MIGTPIQGTLWRVAYRYRKAEDPNSVAAPEPPPKLPAGVSPAMVLAMFGPPPPETTYSGGNVLVVTADSTGADLLSVVERVLAATGIKGTEFTLVTVERMADTVRGLALLEGGAS